MKFSTQRWTYEKILDYISEEEIAMFYLGVNSNSTFYSFFRDENNPGKYLYYKNGRMQYHDCVESRSLPYLIMELNHWSYIDFIDHLKQDFLQVNKTIHPIKKQPKKDIIKHTEIKIKSRDWENYDIEEFWGLGGITLEWLQNPLRGIKPINYYWINDYLNVADKFAYCYIYYWHNGLLRKKIYQPFAINPKNKWKSNIDVTVLQNWDTLPKYNGGKLILSSSFKDTGVIECNLTLPNCRKYFPSAAPNNEGMWLPEVVVPKIRERFEEVFVWFDQDLAGHKAAKKYEIKYGYKSIFIPERFEAKDPFAFRSKYGEKEFVKLSNYLLYEKY